MSLARRHPLIAVAGITGVSLALATPLTSPPIAAAQQESILPSEALHEVHRILTSDESAEQGMVAEQWLKRSRRESLEPAERLALAELFFIGFRPAEADPIFAELEAGTDLAARVAVQRRYRMAMAAYGRFDGVEARIREDRKRLPPIAADPWHFQPAVATLASHYAERGDHAGVVRIIAEEIAGLPVDGVFFSHTLPGAFFASYAALGYGSEALAHLEKVRDALLSGPRIARGEELPDRPHQAGTFHRLEERLLRDQEPADVDRSLRGRLVGTLSGLLARHGSGK